MRLVDVSPRQKRRGMFQNESAASETCERFHTVHNGGLIGRSLLPLRGVELLGILEYFNSSPACSPRPLLDFPWTKVCKKSMAIV